MTRYIAELDYEIDEIPCVIGVTHYEPYVPAYISGPPEDCYPDEGGYSEWEVLKLSGRPYPWLENRMTDEIISHINEFVFNYFENHHR